MPETGISDSPDPVIYLGSILNHPRKDWSSCWRYTTPADISDAVDDALYYLQEVERLDDHERKHYTEQLKMLRSHPLLSDSDKARIDAQLQPETDLVLSPAARYIMDENNMPMFVDRMVARDEMDTIGTIISIFSLLN